MRKTELVFVLAIPFLTRSAEGQNHQRDDALPAVATFGHATPSKQEGSTRPSATLFGGIAVGDNNLDLGLMGGVSFKWELAGIPIDLRFDPSIARYSGDRDGVHSRLLLFNVPVVAEYEIPGSGDRSARFYILAGFGTHYKRLSEDDLGSNDTDNRLDLGLTLGGGVRLNSKLGFEARIVDIDNFTTLPILVTWKLR
jgi:hypothetical protein